MRVALALLVALLSVSSTYGWWCTGHMVIGQIAWDHLEASAQTQVTSIFQKLNLDGPFPMAGNIVDAACWADDLKSEGLVSMASWHFIDQAYSVPAGAYKGKAIQDENVASVIAQLDKTAKHQKIGYILNFAVANLVHFIGDIHQPLHAAELYDKTFPTGDEGGNLYHVSINGTMTHLHFIWDSVCWQWTEPLVRPLNPTNKTWIEDQAKKIVAKYNVSAADKATWNSTQMAVESYDAAVKYAYGGAPAPNGAISAEYIAKCIPVAEMRIAMAGWRLASELNYLFKDSDKIEPKDLATKVDARLNILKKAAKKSPQ